MNLEFEKIKVYYDGGENPFEPAQVVIEPLERGFAQTMGNALRRTMISSMPGSSVIGVKISGVTHEFDLIPNSVDDMTKLILNLKKIRFELENDELVTVRFEKEKEGFYTAGDLNLPTGVKVQNPKQPLINLSGEGLLEFEVYIKKGRGYVDASLHTEFEDRPDVILVDGIFSPVRKVGFRKENMRIGQNANYERLILDVTTDGSVHPKDAVLLASKIMNVHFGAFGNISDIAEKTEIYQEKKEEEDRILDLPIEHLDLSVRAYNCLKREGYTSVRKILNLSEMQIANIHQMGEKSVKEVIRKIKELGFELRKD